MAASAGLLKWCGPMAQTEETNPNGKQDRLVGWKAIAEHLGVSPSTAMRWADHFAMPVSRVPGSSRSVVTAMRHTLDAWQRPDSASANSTDADENLFSAAQEAGVEFGAGEDQESLARAHTALDTSPSRRWVPLTAAVMLAIAAALGVGWLLGEHSAGRAPMLPQPGTVTQPPTLPWQITRGGFAIDVTGGRPLLLLAVSSAGGGSFTISVSSGNLVRVETVAKRVAFTPNLEGERVSLALQQLRLFAGGEGIREVGLRSLARGKTERVVVDGESLDVTWLGVQPREATPGGPAKPVQPCCLSCGTMTVCSDAVSAVCGRCTGQPKVIPPGP
jgi:hypothetical protein